jgi:ectoine hydroxylase-related dioxygenase (phytanoyl-CoA dioxygenase family)
MRLDTRALLTAYDGDGFVVVPELLDAAALARLRGALEAVVSGAGGLPRHLSEKVFFEHQHVRNNPHWYEGVLTPEECGGAVRQIDDLPLFGEEFARLVTHPPLLDVLEALFRSTEFSLVQCGGRPKAPRVGNGISDGHFHRDTPFEEFTRVNTVLVILCLDEMSSANGGTGFVRASHRVSDEEAKQLRWRDVPPSELKQEEIVTPRCAAGSGLFFNTKVLHNATHNRSERPRYSVFLEWVGPGVLPTSAERHAYQGLRPRSRDPEYRRQLEMTFPAFA